MAAQETLQAMLPGAMQGALGTVQASIDQMLQAIQGIATRLDAAENGMSKRSTGLKTITQQWTKRLDEIEGELTLVQTEARGSAYV